MNENKEQKKVWHKPEIVSLEVNEGTEGFPNKLNLGDDGHGMTS